MAINLNGNSLKLFLVPTFLVVALIASVYAVNNPKDTRQGQAKAPGNGAPSGPHYNLNVVGVPKGKTADMTGSAGHKIFVPMVGNCKLNLATGDFAVPDADCTDGPATFQLPNPDPDNDGTTTYSVWAKALGTPGGGSSANMCATEPATGDVWCSVYKMVQVRNTGRSVFNDVSKDLLSIYTDINGDGKTEHYNLFNDALQDYYWSFDESGLRLMQLRFYEELPSVN